MSEEGRGSYEIIVRDTGIGMSREFVEKMFTPFERERTSTASKTEGTGLGLAICKSIVDLMGGTINVVTSPGKGTETVLNLTLKLATEDEIKEYKKAKKKESGVKADFTQKRLLLVEDNAVNMEIAKMILTKSGFKVETAENGKIAVDKVSAAADGYYDVILMDIQMPEMDGYTATKHIRALDNKALAQIPILAMTANAFKEDEEQAIAVGMQGHITKPINVEVLLKTITDVLSADNAGE